MFSTGLLLKLRFGKKKLSQTNICNTFPSSVPYNTVSKILQSNCKQACKKYILARSM